MFLPRRRRKSRAKAKRASTSSFLSSKCFFSSRLPSSPTSSPHHNTTPAASLLLVSIVQSSFQGVLRLAAIAQLHRRACLFTSISTSKFMMLSCPQTRSGDERWCWWLCSCDWGYLPSTEQLRREPSSLTNKLHRRQLLYNKNYHFINWTGTWAVYTVRLHHHYQFYHHTYQSWSASSLYFSIITTINSKASVESNTSMISSMWLTEYFTSDDTFSQSSLLDILSILPRRNSLQTSTFHMSKYSKAGEKHLSSTIHTSRTSRTFTLPTYCLYYIQYRRLLRIRISIHPSSNIWKYSLSSLHTALQCLGNIHRLHRIHRIQQCGPTILPINIGHNGSRHLMITMTMATIMISLMITIFKAHPLTNMTMQLPPTCLPRWKPSPPSRSFAAFARRTPNSPTSRICLPTYHPNLIWQTISSSKSAPKAMKKQKNSSRTTDSGTTKTTWTLCYLIDLPRKTRKRGARKRRRAFPTIQDLL